MAKKTYVATSSIQGLEPPKKDKSGNDIEHVLREGDEYQMEEEAAAPFVAGGSLVLKGKPAAADPGA